MQATETVRVDKSLLALDQVSVSDLLTRYGLSLNVWTPNLREWTADIVGADFKNSSDTTKIGLKIGIGESVDMAIAQLARKLGGKVMVIDATNERRKEILLPQVITS